jgi:hypothetical protein
MTDYANDLEQQNEELRKKLAVAEKKALDGEMAHKVLYQVLRNTGFTVAPSNQKFSITLSYNEVTITKSDIGEDCLFALEDLLVELKKKRPTMQMRDFADVFKNMLLDSRKELDRINNRKNTI